MVALDKPLAGRYALRRRLAAGGHAQVYEAVDLQLGRNVAVKLLAERHSVIPEEVQRLEREARVTASISHPNVCGVTDAGKLESGAPFVVLELLTGESLASRLKREGKLSIDAALVIAQQVLLGLDAAHARGVVHRDLKPGNIFLTDLGHGRSLAKIIDFGTAFVPGLASIDSLTLTETGVVVGTAEYMSPEQLRGVRDFDPRTDVYSCGVVLFEMLTGRRPFSDRTPAEILRAIGFETPPSIAGLVPGLSAPIAYAIDVSLANARERRPPSAGALLELLASDAPPPATGVTDIVSREAATGAFQDWEATTLENRAPQVRDDPVEPATEIIRRPPRT